MTLGDPKELRHELGHLLGVLDPLLAIGDVGVAAVGHDGLGHPSLDVVAGDLDRRPNDLIRRKDAGGDRRRGRGAAR